MSIVEPRYEKKAAYAERIIVLLEKYSRVLLVLCDNIGSSHMQKIRINLRGKAILLMGKNTMMRRAIREALKPNEAGVVRGNPLWANLVPHIKYNVGLVFTDQDLPTIRDLLLATRVPAAAKVGAVAPQDVIVPKGITTLEPTKTSFFAALDIATKITKGSVEMLNDVQLITKGAKVGNSEAALLQMLGINPFTYGLLMTVVYDSGAVFSSQYLDYGEEELMGAFAAGVSNVAGISLALSIPSLAAFPHTVMNAFKNIAAVSFGTNYTFPLAEKLKSAAASAPAKAAAPVKSAADKAAADKAKAAEEEKKKKDAEEAAKKKAKKDSDDDGGGMGDIFGF